MVVGTALRERGFNEAKRLCYSGLDAPTLLREVAGRLRRVVPFEAYCATSNDPLSGLLTHVVHDGVMGEKEQRTYLEAGGRLLRRGPGRATQDGTEPLSGSATVRSYRWEYRACSVDEQVSSRVNVSPSVLRSMMRWPCCG